MRQVCRMYALPQRPGVRFFKSRHDWRGAWMRTGERGDNPQLVINSDAPFGLTCLLHELAHLIDDYYFDVKGDWHGPRFCGIASWLYDHFGAMPSYAYEAILKKHKVKFHPASKCSPAYLKSRSGP